MNVMSHASNDGLIFTKDVEKIKKLKTICGVLSTEQEKKKKKTHCNQSRGFEISCFQESSFTFMQFVR